LFELFELKIAARLLVCRGHLAFYLLSWLSTPLEKFSPKMESLQKSKKLCELRKKGVKNGSWVQKC